MQIEEYFDFLSPEDIRIRGHRIGIESILDEYISRGRTPEQIQKRFPTLGLDQVYATILYYLQDKEVVGGYVEDWLEHGRRMREEQARNPTAGALKLRELLRQRRDAGAPAK